MDSRNNSGLSTGYVSIPVEIVSRPNSTVYDSPYRTTRYDSTHSDFSNSPPWKKPSTNSYYRSRLQPRQTLGTAYDRLINESSFKQPSNDHHFYPSYQQSQNRPLHKRTHESSSLQTSHSSDDLLSSSNDFMRPNRQSHVATSFYPSTYNNDIRFDSDFIHPSKYSDSFRRSIDVLDDFLDTNHRSHYQPTYVSKVTINPTHVRSNEYHKSTNHYQPNKSQGINNNSHDRSGSPASQRDESPTRPSPSQESDFKVTKDTTSLTAGQNGPLSPSNDQQVPSTEASSSTNIPPVPPRDSNTIAIEKLELLKQNLVDLNLQVDAFNGSTRDDRLYKLLDEQGVKMMLSCDELTDVSVDIKEKRKEMIRNVQTVIAKLEAKVPINSTIGDDSNRIETTNPVFDSSFINVEQKQQQQSSPKTQNEDISMERST